MITRLATDDDLPHIRRLYTQLYEQMSILHPKLFLPVPPPDKLIERFIHADESDIIVGVSKKTGKILGFITMVIEHNPLCEFYVHKRFAYLSDIVVDEEVRSSGIGHQLFSAAKDWAREHHIHQLTLDVVCTNKKGIRFYEREGCEFSTHTMMLDISLPPRRRQSVDSAAQGVEPGGLRTEK